MVDGEGRKGATARPRIWAGSITLSLGCFLIGDAVHRGREVLDAAAQWWPWALLALAAFNLLRSAISVGSLIGPAVLAAAALCGLALSHGLDTRTVQNLGVPLLLAGTGILLLLGATQSHPRTRWSRVVSTGRVQVPPGSGELLVFRAVCGELHANLTATGAAGPSTVHVTAVAGRVHLLVPRTWQVMIHASGALLTHVSETGRRNDGLSAGHHAEALHPGSHPGPTPGAPHEVDVHLLGVCGAVSIAYT